MIRYNITDFQQKFIEYASLIVNVSILYDLYSYDTPHVLLINLFALLLFNIIPWVVYLKKKDLMSQEIQDIILSVCSMLFANVCLVYNTFSINKCVEEECCSFTQYSNIFDWYMSRLLVIATSFNTLNFYLTQRND